jgi:hypothetical protein
MFMTITLPQVAYVAKESEKGHLLRILPSFSGMVQSQAGDCPLQRGAHYYGAKRIAEIASCHRFVTAFDRQFSN